MDKLPSNHSATCLHFNGGFTSEIEDGARHATRRPSPSFKAAYRDILDAASSTRTFNASDPAATRPIQRLLGKSTYAVDPAGKELTGQTSYLDRFLQSFLQRFSQSRLSSWLFDEENDDNDFLPAQTPLAPNAASQPGIWACADLPERANSSRVPRSSAAFI